LQKYLAGFERCRLLPGLSDRELAHQLAAADVFVLATRTRGGSSPSGEGFGLVLLEAQVAGTAVVAPAYGGSGGAYIEGITGMAPTDESADSLTRVLRKMSEDPSRLDKMGAQAAEWARECFRPERYAALAVSRLLPAENDIGH
jgi:glycosyltransferase involved in cell wall biosynthesis